MDGGASMSATFKPGHKHQLNLTMGLETLVFFGNKVTLRSIDWLVSVKTLNNDYKTLHAHGWNEEMWVHKK